MIISLLLGLLLSGSSIDYENTHVLEIQVENILEATGQIMIAVYDSDEEFLGQNAALFQVVAADATSVVTRVRLEPGMYAISVYHDVNGNRKLDRNLARIPKEPYGFSNNARGRIGPPSFEQTQFEILGPASVSIRLK